MKSPVHPSQIQSVSTSHTYPEQTHGMHGIFLLFSFPTPAHRYRSHTYFLSSNGFSTYSSSSSSSLGRVAGGEFAFSSDTGRFGSNPILAGMHAHQRYTPHSTNDNHSPAFTGLPLEVVGGLGTSPEGRGDAAGDSDAPPVGPVGRVGTGAATGGALRCAGGASRSYPCTGPRAVVEGPFREMGCSAAGLGSPA